MVGDICAVEFLGRPTGGRVGIGEERSLELDKGLRVLAHPIHDFKTGFTGQLGFRGRKIEPLGSDWFNSNVNDENLNRLRCGGFHVDESEEFFIKVKD